MTTPYDSSKRDDTKFTGTLCMLLGGLMILTSFFGIFDALARYYTSGHTHYHFLYITALWLIIDLFAILAIHLGWLLHDALRER
ncbi:hypothetical protein GVX82_02285 [Patescibacteria group bacterium]|jgi:hypothetical protein|nr:hypothetical protein [Patescibacteria group bacterium]